MIVRVVLSIVVAIYTIAEPPALIHRKRDESPRFMRFAAGIGAILLIWMV